MNDDLQILLDDDKNNQNRNLDSFNSQDEDCSPVVRPVHN